MSSSFRQRTPVVQQCAPDASGGPLEVPPHEIIVIVGNMAPLSDLVPVADGERDVTDHGMGTGWSTSEYMRGTRLA